MWSVCSRPAFRSLLTDFDFVAVFWSEDNEPVPLVKIGAPRHTRPLYRSDGHKLKLQSVHKIMDYQKTRPARNALALRAAVKLEHPVLSDPVYSFAFVVRHLFCGIRLP